MGGRLVVNGTYDELLANEESLTAAYLSGRQTIPIPEDRVEPVKERWITISGARQNNLQDIEVRIPLGCMVAVTGVSGSGKSSLVTETLAPALLGELHGTDATLGAMDSIQGLEMVDEAIVIDQSQ